MNVEAKFIADVHLGKLARILRLLGFDTLYKNSYTNRELLTISMEENRILLSRNAALNAKGGVNGLVLNTENPLEQVMQVVGHFKLKEFFRPFSRCIICNGILEPVTKENILHLLQQNTRDYFREFWQCSHCKRVYWKGSHYEQMLKTIEKIP